MQQKSLEEVIEYRKEKANESLLAAEVLLKNQFYSAAINRLYYSCFYIATALLLKKGVQVKSHSGVLKMIGLHLVQTEILSKETGRYYAELFTYRQDNDYGDFIIIEEELANDLFLKAKKFVYELQNLLTTEN